MEGNLFKQHFLSIGIQATREWQSAAADPLGLIEFEAGVEEPYGTLAKTPDANEATTEQELIRPVLEALGWRDYLPQQGGRRNEDVPDLLLFADPAAKQAAMQAGSSEALRHAVAVVESKRFDRSLDAWDGSSETPARQMRRYLTTADIETDGALRWGILTNGRIWRLYDQRARPRESGYFEADLGEIFASRSAHDLRVFQLLFRRDSFLPDDDGAAFLELALEEGQRYGERVADDLSGIVFDVFRDLLAGMVAAADASLAEIREAALILLYRILFVFYAEDRGLLPIREPVYQGYGLRQRLRDDIAVRLADGQRFSSIATNYHDHLAALFRMIDAGDASIGLPPYNGGLFASRPLLDAMRLPDAVLAPIVHRLSHRPEADGVPRFVNYRDLSVQQLGSIYERLLEHEPVRAADGGVGIRLNPYSRKQSGSFYTPRELVDLVVEQTLGPLVDARIDAFAARAAELGPMKRRVAERLRLLQAADAAEAVLNVKVVDPAMGSGHFLVAAVDYLAGRIADLMDHPPRQSASWLKGYESPLVARVAKIRAAIAQRAEAAGWRIAETHLTEQAIVRRLVLKRCIYGVDKNPMAVELAKVSLWLHSFTAGAPLSFLDHHLRCGDSLFGLRVAQALEDLHRLGQVFAASAIQGAETASAAMQRIEENADADLAEVQASATLFDGMEQTTAELRGLLAFLHGHRWLTAGSRAKDRKAYEAPLIRVLANTADAYRLLCSGPLPGDDESGDGRRFAEIWRDSSNAAAQEAFLHWEVAFPGVWRNWQSNAPSGGFDAVIGNPPWDRMKLQQVEWFAARRPAIAAAQRAADRRRLIGELQRGGDPLAAEFDAAAQRAARAMRAARAYGDYPYLSGGDTNLYSLFVERAFSLLKPDGVLGLLTPSGIASDKTAARFFRTVAGEGRLRALYDFENRRTRYRMNGKGMPPFFPDIDTRFKFCALIAGAAPTDQPTDCAFFLQSVSELDDAERRFQMAAEDFRLVNPNTGTAPIFRSRRDAELTTAIYRRLPVLVDRSGGDVAAAWPVRYQRMFDMTNDSAAFRTREELQENEGAWPVAGNVFDSPSGPWVPLYEGKMVQAFDHRAASVVVNLDNRFRPAQAVAATAEQHANPHWRPAPQFYVRPADCNDAAEPGWAVAFKDVTAPTNARTMIAAMVPACGAGNTLPLLQGEDVTAARAATIVANLNAVLYDYLARQKVQGQHLNWYIVEQLPVIPGDGFERHFGDTPAAEVIRDAVLELTYTAHDMAPFARDLGYVDEAGAVKPPFPWNEDRRVRLRAKLDAVFFHLYGVTDRDDVRYVYSTFPIVEREETATHGRYLSRDLCLAYMNALPTNPNAEVVL